MLLKIIPVIVISSLLVLAGYILGRRVTIVTLNTKKNQNTQINTEKDPTPQIPTPQTTEEKNQTEYSRQVLNTKLSPDGNYLAYITSVKNEGAHNIEFMAVEQNPRHFVQRDSLLPIWTYSVNENQNYNSYLTWSESGKFIAVAIGTEFKIYSITNQGKNSDNKETIIVKEAHSGKLNSDLMGDLGFWFNEVKLLAYFGTNVSEIWPSNKVLLYLPNSVGIYPTNNEYFYWERKESGYGLRLFKLSSDGKATDTGATSDDYGSLVISNKQGNLICFEQGASGYWGYQIYDIENKKILLSGQQYSYCGKWLDDNRITLTEVPYFTQFTTQVYIYNAITNTREPAVMFNNERF